MAAMTVLFSSMFAAISIVWEREFGFLKELLVAPIPRGAIVAAKLAAGSATAMLEAGLMLALAPLIGARFSAVGALAALPLLAVFGMAVNALGIVVAARMKSFEGFGSVVNFVIQPIFFLSGALYPIDGLPRALRVVVLLNPMSYVVDAVRGLCLGPHAFPLALDVAVTVAAALAFGALARRAFLRMEA
jgi:ABC-2 type transport system permease protein